jgi:hypothetical protein
MGKVTKVPKNKSGVIKQESLVGTLKEVERILRFANKLIPNNDGSHIELVPHISSTKASCYGWFSENSWSTREGELKSEIAIPPEHLDRSPEEITETLIHETAHAWNSARGIEDCSSNQYHNKKFKETAESLGLVTEKTKKGYGLTSLSEPLRKKINTQLKPDTTKFNLFKLKRDKDKKPPSKRLVWICKCGIKISLARGKVLDATCNVCNTKFQLEVK